MSKRICNPQDTAAINRDHIKSARRHGGKPLPAKPDAGRTPNLGLLADIHRVRSGAKTGEAAIPDFHEHDGALITHHQVEFPKPKAHIAGQQAHSPILQMLQSQGLGSRALTLGRS